MSLKLKEITIEELIVINGTPITPEIISAQRELLEWGDSEESEKDFIAECAMCLGCLSDDVTEQIGFDIPKLIFHLKNHHSLLSHMIIAKKEIENEK